jgi:hypothetical protein
MRRIAVLLALCVCLASFSSAGELAGVTMDDEVTVGGEQLTLNGMGLRKKMWVKVYVAGLYLGSPTSDGDAAVSAGGAKRIVMHFLTNKATKKKMDAAWFEGFEANSPEEFAKLDERVSTFADAFGDMKVDDIVELTIVPGEGTTVTLNGQEKAVIAGDDFAAALLRVWLGDHPPDEEMKVGMLGG